MPARTRVSAKGKKAKAKPTKPRKVMKGRGTTKSPKQRSVGAGGGDSADDPTDVMPAHSPPIPNTRKPKAKPRPKAKVKVAKKTLKAKARAKAKQKGKKKEQPTVPTASSAKAKAKGKARKQAKAKAAPSCDEPEATHQSDRSGSSPASSASESGSSGPGSDNEPNHEPSTALEQVSTPVRRVAASQDYVEEEFCPPAASFHCFFGVTVAAWVMLLILILYYTED